MSVTLTVDTEVDITGDDISRELLAQFTRILKIQDEHVLYIEVDA